MKLVGLTGGIGSGKSTVSRMFETMGATIIDADQLAREVVAPGTPGLAAIVEHFGREVLNDDGALDRPTLGRKIFKDPEARTVLNRIVHPLVAARAQEAVVEAEANGAQLVLYDVPLLYENKLDQALPEVVVVCVEAEVQRARIAARDALPPDEIADRIAAQMPLAEKARRANHVIDNNGHLEHTQAQVRALFKKWMQELPS